MPYSKVRSNPAPSARFRMSRQLPLAVAIFLLLLFSIGIAFFQSVKKQIEIDAYSNLESVARLKVGQIESWLEEGNSDAILTIGTQAFVEDLRLWLDGGRRDNKRRELLLVHLRQLTAVGQFRNVSLYDTQGRLLITTAISGTDPAGRSAFVMTAIQKGETILEEFYIDDSANNKGVSVGFLSPIRAVANSPPLAVLHVSLNPEQQLYPLLQQWPGTSRSAETLLVLRNGEDVVYLNTLRHIKNDPLSMRLPLASSQLIAAKVLNGQSGNIFGLDYRKQRCLAYSMQVPGTAWHIISKIDEDEVFANLHKITLFAIAMVGILLGITGLWLRQYYRDIGEREKSNARIGGLSRTYATLSAVNRAIARGIVIEEVFHAACCACVERGRLVHAWIGLADPDGDGITVNQRSGASLNGLPSTRVSTRAETAEGQGPTGIALRERRACVCNDISSDPAALPWRDQAAHAGICSMIALPIIQDGAVVAMLAAYSDRKNFFDIQIENLFHEVADSLSFAMRHFADNKAKRQIEAELRQSEELLQEAQEIARIGHWQYDLETRTAFWSPQMYRLFERDPALGPNGVQEGDAGYSPYPEQSALESMHRAVTTGQRVDLEIQINLSGNRIAYHAAAIMPYRDKNGRTLLIRGTVQDITERKLAEKGLQDTTNAMLQYAQEVEDLYQNAPCGYHSLDKNGVFRRINETELKWLGYRRDELIGKKSLQDLLVPEEVSHFQQAFPRFIETGEIHDLETEFTCKDGGRLPVLINATAILDNEGCFLMTRSTTYNMTERKKMERERLDYSRRLENLSRRLVTVQEKGRRELSAALHDRTSPNLAALEINLNLVASSIPQDRSPEIADLLEDTRALLKDTSLSIREICSELRPPVLDYAGLVPALEGYARQFSRRTGTAVRVSCADSVTRLAPDQESLLFRIIQEAITNCAKHAGASSIEVALKCVNGATVLTIADDGKGFNPELIWENGENVGQGLLNMREMSEFIGGSFAIDSSPGKGTTIRIEL